MTNKKPTIKDIPVSQIIITGGNDRKHFNDQALRDLAASIKEHGLAQNPTVRQVGRNRYELVAGERRTRAMRDILQWETIPCVVREMDDKSASSVMLAENTGRVDLNPIEEGQAYAKRMEKFGLDINEIARIAGVKVTQVEDRLVLLKLIDDIQHLVKFGQFPEKYALPLAKAVRDHKLDSNRQRIAMKAYNAAANMPLHRWKGVLDELVAAQVAESQISMFDLEFKLVSQVVQLAQYPSKGVQARTGAKANRDLPPVRRSDSDSMAPLFDRYISDLIAEGHEEGAGAVANIYNVMVARGWVIVKDGLILQESDAGIVETELHEVVI